jgi:DNA-directed RNA polymerase specialized sigma24 family protein
MFSVTPEELVRIEKRALHYALKLKRSSYFRSDQTLDLQQDLALKVIESWKNFDEQRGTSAAFAEEVLKNTYRNMIRGRLCSKRRGLQVSFDDVAEKISLDEGEEWTNEIHQRVDVERYVKKSPIFLQKLMNEIQNNSLRKVARTFGVPRSRLRELVEYCRRTLAPLEEFVNGADFLVFKTWRAKCISH